MSTRIRAIAMALLMALPPALAAAQDAPSAADTPVAPEATATAGSDAAEAAGKSGGKVLSMKIGVGDDGEDADRKAHGIVISVDDDEESAEVAGAVVDRVVGEIEQALADLPEDVRAELEADDIDDLRRALEDVRRLKHGSGELKVIEQDSSDVIPGVLAILLLFGGPIVIVAIVSFNNRRKRQMVHQTIDKIIDQGREVPVELLDALDKGQNGKSRLARGMVSVALGLGLGGMLLATAGAEVATIGLIPLCIGLAHLLVWKLEKAPAEHAASG